MGSTQHPRDATRERCADEHSPSGDCECAASDLSLMYAGDRGRKERRSSNHWRRSSERRWIATRPFGVTTRFRRTERLRVRGTTRWIFPSGWIYWHPTCTFGARLGCGRGASFENAPEPNATGLGPPFGAGSRGAERSSLRAGSDRHRRAVDLRADGEHRTQEPDKAETPCLPSTFRVGDAEAGLEPRGETSSTETSGRRDSAAASESCRSKAHGSIERCAAERLRGRNGLLGGTTP